MVIAWRVVDAATVEVLRAGEARGLSSARPGRLRPDKDDRDVSGKGFGETLIGEATINCIDKLVEALIGFENQIPGHRQERDGRVTDVSPPRVSISLGLDDGVQVGDRFSVSRVVAEFLDPLTKVVLDLQLDKAGEFVVTEVAKESATGSFNGPSAPQVGYVARKISPPQYK